MCRGEPRPCRRAVALLAVLVAAAGCGELLQREPPNVLLVSIDSLRADRLHCYGNPRDTSPTMDRLAAAGTRFARAYSPTSWTLPSHVTLLTGLEQPSHRVVSMFRRIPEHVPLLATMLSERGYQTMGVFSGPYLDPHYGFDRGFDEYLSCQGESLSGEGVKEVLNRSHADETNPCLRDTMATWVRERMRPPFFAFLHMWDVHYDYIPPPEYVQRYDSSYRGKLDGRRIAVWGFPLNASQRDVAHLLARYDGEVRYTDDTLGEMLAALDAAGQLANTVVIVTSDHGDEFLEHGKTGHQKTVFAESVHVPLIVRGPGVPRGRVVERPVSLADVAPTILELLRVEEEVAMDGTSLLGLMRGKRADHPPVQSVLYEGSLSPFIHDVTVRDAAGTIRLEAEGKGWVAYDWPADPLEQVPRPIDEPERISTGLAALATAREGTAPPPTRDQAPKLPPHLERRLRELGYVE